MAPPQPGIDRLEAFFTGHAYDPHRHDTYAIGYTLEGVQSFRYRGAQANSTTGKAIVLHPDERHDGRAGTASGFRYRMLYIEPRLVREALGDRTRSLPFIRVAVSTNPPLISAMRPAFDDLNRILEALEVDQLILAVADVLLKLDRSARGKSPSPVCTIAVENTRQFLDEHCGRTVTSEELEALTGIDRYTLARHFRARLGTSPYRYLTMRRLDRARAHICAGYSLTEAALANGFADQSHMTRQFKQAYGLSPGRWRAMNRARE